MPKNTLFGLKIYVDGADKLISDIKGLTDRVHIISGAAPVLRYPLDDQGLYEQFNSERNIIIPDGITVLYPMMIRNRKCRKIRGIDLMEKLLVEFQATEKSVYFLGAKEEVLQRMIEQFAKRYPKLKIAGYHNGYFDKNDCTDIVEDIKHAQPHALFVALGAPAQERFIFKYMDELPCRVFMGVGGSFDVFSGTIKPCPKWMCDLNLEWIYRSIKDITKAYRYPSNISFIIKALIKG